MPKSQSNVICARVLEQLERYFPHSSPLLNWFGVYRHSTTEKLLATPMCGTVDMTKDIHTETHWRDNKKYWRTENPGRPQTSGGQHHLGDLEAEHRLTGALGCLNRGQAALGFVVIPVGAGSETKLLPHLHSCWGIAHPKVTHYLPSSAGLESGITATPGPSQQMPTCHCNIGLCLFPSVPVWHGPMPASVSTSWRPFHIHGPMLGKPSFVFVSPVPKYGC